MLHQVLDFEINDISQYINQAVVDPGIRLKRVSGSTTVLNMNIYGANSCFNAVST